MKKRIGMIVLLCLLVLAGVYAGAQGWVYATMESRLLARDYVYAHAIHGDGLLLLGREETKYWDEFCIWKINATSEGIQREDSSLPADWFGGYVRNAWQYANSGDGEVAKHILREMDATCKENYDAAKARMEAGDYAGALEGFAHVPDGYGGKDSMAAMAELLKKVQELHRTGALDSNTCGEYVEKIRTLEKDGADLWNSADRNTISVCKEKWKTVRAELIQEDIRKAGVKATKEAAEKQEYYLEKQKEYPILTLEEIGRIYEIYSYPHKYMFTSSLNSTPLGRAILEEDTYLKSPYNYHKEVYRWSGKTTDGKNKTIATAYCKDGQVESVSYYGGVCGFDASDTEDILNYKMDAFDIATNKKKIANKNSSSGSNSSFSGSSGSKAHGFAGSTDEWEDYDDYMDDYHNWEHGDVDDMDDWEDDWDEEE